MRSFCIYTISIVFFSFFSCENEKSSSKQLSEAAEKRLSFLVSHHSEWIKVHAAEFCLDLDLDLPIDSIFKIENKINSAKTPYRIGIWRVLAQSDKDAKRWIDKIIKIASDTSATDQLHAIETLAKLKVAPDWVVPKMKSDILKGKDLRLKSFTQWAMATPHINDQKPVIDSLFKMLSSSEVVERQIAAIAFQKLNYFPEGQWNHLAQIAINESRDSKAKVFLLSTALFFSTDHQAPQFKTLKKSLLAYRHSANKTQRYSVCETMAQIGNREDLSWLTDLMFMTNPIISIETLESPQEHPWNIDVSSAAAYAVLKILQRS